MFGSVLAASHPGPQGILLDGGEILIVCNDEIEMPFCLSGLDACRIKETD